MPTTMDWNLFDDPAPLVNMASRSLMRLGDRRVRPLGLGISQMPVLYLLREGGAMSQKELARHAKVEQPSMAQTLARMERDGLIKRSPDPEDGRRSLISLTKKALSRLALVREALQADNGKELEGFSDVEISTLVDLLRRLNGNLDRLLLEESR